MDKYCCASFEKMVETHEAYVGGGLYPDRPDGQFEKQQNGSWSINGCCGGGCYVVSGVAYCPFCGTNLLPDTEQERT